MSEFPISDSTSAGTLKPAWSTRRVGVFVEEGQESGSSAGGRLLRGTAAGGRRGVASGRGGRLGRGTEHFREPLPLEDPGDVRWVSSRHLARGGRRGFCAVGKTARAFRSLKSPRLRRIVPERSPARAASVLRTRDAAGARGDPLGDPLGGVAPLGRVCRYFARARARAPELREVWGRECLIGWWRRQGRWSCSGDAAVAREAAGRPGQARAPSEQPGSASRGLHSAAGSSGEDRHHFLSGYVQNHPKELVSQKNAGPGADGGKRGESRETLPGSSLGMTKVSTIWLLWEQVDWLEVVNSWCVCDPSLALGWCLRRMPLLVSLPNSNPCEGDHLPCCSTVDTFERNLDTVHWELGIVPPKQASMVYTTESDRAPHHHRQVHHLHGLPAPTEAG
ncbi:unnamed protein product [Nyctereutes procyonoides]|uniref:(raccoon dog) hypothetical protein n=1 Tax=Nyctereutes procyonoides TaxID=34880 RepID=A0A811ZK57_NYCPR|nr:unnamed protein product [Nyctereutes procyonoides]